MTALPAKLPLFDGKTYRPARDGKRLTTQQQVVREIMSDGNWHWLHQVVAEVVARTSKRATDSGVSARIRDLRKPRHGSWTVNTRVRPGSGAWEYQAIKSSDSSMMPSCKVSVVDVKTELPALHGTFSAKPLPAIPAAGDTCRNGGVACE